MKKAIVIAMALMLVSTVAFAGLGNNPSHKVAVHVKAHPTSCTKGYPAFTACNQIVTTWVPQGDVDVMPVFYDLTEVLVVEFAMTWPVEWYSMSWIRCKGDLAIGTVKYSGDGTAISWMTCQTSWSIAPGAGWLAASGPGMVCIVANPATGMYGVVDCQPSPGPYMDPPALVTCAGIAGMVGGDPCAAIATEPSTWGQIKSMFK
ncbi:MAG: hypothetical protein WAW06_08810 [bacterium]